MEKLESDSSSTDFFSTSSPAGTTLEGKNKNKWKSDKLTALGAAPDKSIRTPYKILMGMKKAEKHREEIRNRRVLDTSSTSKAQSFKYIFLDARGSRIRCGEAREEAQGGGQ